MADPPFKPDETQWEALQSALIMVYADIDQFRDLLVDEFPHVAASVTFLQPAKNVTFETLDQVDRQGAEWPRFLRAVRRKRPDSAVLSAIVDRILLSGALKGLRGT